MNPGRRHWFHVSHYDHGPVWDVGMTRPSIIGDGEPETPRLCVCEFVSRCLTAVLPCRGMFVYRTERERRSVRPVGVSDQVITRERWLIPPVRMLRVGEVPAAVCERIVRPTVEYMMANGRRMSHAQRVRQLETATREMLALNPSWAVRSDLKFCRLVEPYLVSKGYGP